MLIGYLQFSSAMRLEKRILVVDDDDAIRALVSTVLRRRGLRVDHARNGVEALERLAECDYALVVLDLMMPRMSGYELLENIASSEQSRPLVLVLTAGFQTRHFHPGLVVGSIQKPFDIELLVDTVTGCLTATSTSARRPGCGAETAKLAIPSGDVN